MVPYTESSRQCTAVRCHGSGESGNTVALTLLGLAVAILAGIGVLFFVGNVRNVPLSPVPQASSSVEQTDAAGPVHVGWSTYEDATYHFSLQYPPDWVVATGTVDSVPVITIVPAEFATSTHDLLRGERTSVSVFPRGATGILPEDTEQQSLVIVSTPDTYAKDLVLKNGRSWATVVRFNRHPDSWSSDGFVFARTSVEDGHLLYLRGETEITSDLYDATSGDRMVRDGYVDAVARSTTEDVVRSFVFLDPSRADSDVARVSSSTAGTTIEGADTLVRVDEPLPNSRITNPFRVSGEITTTVAHSDSWYVHLVAAGGTLLARTAVDIERDSTANTAHFTAVVEFGTTTATSGYVLIGVDDPEPTASGTIPVSRVPILFPVGE